MNIHYKINLRSHYVGCTEQHLSKMVYTDALNPVETIGFNEMVDKPAKCESNRELELLFAKFK